MIFQDCAPFLDIYIVKEKGWKQEGGVKSCSAAQGFKREKRRFITPEESRKPNIASHFKTP